MSQGIQRRDFLKVLGVSGAGASMAGCSTDEVERLIPYVVPPEEITPGVSTWYATVHGDSDDGYGLWVRTREGRAVLIEGNPNHPVNAGSLGVRDHAALQHLYNPDRFTGPMRRVDGQLQSITWDDAEQLLADQIRSAGGNVLLLHGAVGPSTNSLIDTFMDAVGGRRVRFDPLADVPLLEAARIAFGPGSVPRYEIGNARFLLSFGADFLDAWGSSVANTRGFTAMHHVDSHGAKGHFVFLGPRLSLTGQNADEWLPIQPGSEALVALAMANVIARRGGNAGPYTSLLSAYDPQAAAAASGIEAALIEELAERFVSEGPGLAIGPGIQGHHAGATAANLAVLILNSVAGAVGRTLHVSVSDVQPVGQASLLNALRQSAGGVVMVRDVNPAYALPPGSGFSDAFNQAAFRVSFATCPDETTASCDLVLPDRHFLEGWGDSSPRPGLWAIQQPVMRPVPMFDSKQTGDVLISVGQRLGNDFGVASFSEHVQVRWRALQASMGSGGSFEAEWREILRRGYLDLTESVAVQSPQLRAPDAVLSFDAPGMGGEGLILSVYPSGKFGDGRHANSPWLQELPDSVSKIMWQPWLEMHPSMADELGLKPGDVVRVSSDQSAVELPVWPYPGIRRDVVALATGGGHTDYGRFATDVGVNAMSLLSGDTETASGATILLGARVQVEPTGDWQKLATNAGSESQDNRGIAPAIALAELGEDHGEGDEGHAELQELQLMGGFKPVETEGRPEDYPLPGSEYGLYADAEARPRWAMAVDLDKCTGCSACVTACQSENNVPWVGLNQVLMGREMHWMRIERYYEHVDAEHSSHVDIRRVPMLCQHCGNAPCEPVCPVFAAYHTPEGLNGQIYNRCVGTRYCANNCPYKVRVFNWYGYTSQIPEPMNWQFNPDVTVRDNGVMEKCTFCVQRIKEAQNRAAVEGRTVEDGEIVPACEHTCPADAIVFGNIRDPNSRVAQATANSRSYRVLDEFINTQPAVTYLKKVTFHEVDSGH